MTTATEAIKAALDAGVALGPLITNGDSPETFRSHPILAPQGTAKPYVTYQKITGGPLETMDEAVGNTQNYRYRFISYATELIDAEAVNAALRSALKATTTFRAVHVFEADDHELDTGLYSVTADYSIWYK